MLDREIKIKRLFDIASNEFAVLEFDDGTENILLPRIKLERYKLDDKYRYNILNSSSEIYMPLEDWLIDFALDKGIEMLSYSMMYTYALNKLEKARRRKTKSDEEYEKKLQEVQKYSSKTQQLKSKSINLNLIKENYVTRIKPENGKTNPVNS